MLIVYILQTALPLALIGWLAWAPPRSVTGFWAQALATAASLMALGLVGVWTFPPWWAVWGFAGLLALAIISVLLRPRNMTRWPSGTAGWAGLAGFIALAIYALVIARSALIAAAMPEGKVVRLTSPLGPGSYFVANGGAAASINAHAAFLDRTIASHRTYWGTGHGVDIVGLDRWGRHAEGVMPANSRRYTIFGRGVVAPCAGKIIAVVDGLPDMPVPQLDRAHLAGNHVVLRCADADILLGHFRNGSLSVRVGDKLKAGAAIAQVGNSGNTSEPHLHVHAQQPGTSSAPFSGAPIPISIEGRYLVRNSRFVVPVRTSGADAKRRLSSSLIR